MSQIFFCLLGHILVWWLVYGLFVLQNLLLRKTIFAGLRLLGAQREVLCNLFDFCWVFQITLYEIPIFVVVGVCIIFPIC